MSATSWWGRKWLESVRPSRKSGRRSGQILEIAESGEALVQVGTSSVHPTEVTFRARALPESAWTEVAKTTRGRALFSAKLLAGELPADIEDAFHQAGASLFPTQREAVWRCSCGNTECAHIDPAARTLAHAIDRDPFLLFELRGYPIQRVLQELGLPVDGTGSTFGSRNGGRVVETIPLDREGYRRMRAELGDMHFHIDAPARGDALFELLGDPRGWTAPPSFRDALAPFLGAGIAAAQELAFSAEEDAES